MKMTEIQRKKLVDARKSVDSGHTVTLFKLCAVALSEAGEHPLAYQAIRNCFSDFRLKSRLPVQQVLDHSLLNAILSKPVIEHMVIEAQGMGAVMPVLAENQVSDILDKAGMSYDFADGQFVFPEDVDEVKLVSTHADLVAAFGDGVIQSLEMGNTPSFKFDMPEEWEASPQEIPTGVVDPITGDRSSGETLDKDIDIPDSGDPEIFSDLDTYMNQVTGDVQKNISSSGFGSDL